MPPVNSFKPLHPKVVLGVAAHPDDLEFSIAGSVATWVKEGAEVYYLILTDGSKGTDDKTATPKQLTDTRRREQQAAADILGVKKVFFCDYEDGTLECSRDVKRDVVRVIRQTKPEVVMCMNPTEVFIVSRGMINHSDHRAAGMAAIDSVYPLARDHLSLPELYTDEHLEPHKVKTILLTSFDNQNFGVDISDSMDVKLKALAAHASQISDIEGRSEMVKQWAAHNGASFGAKYVESFLRLDLPF
jgi:LmbE family N-acetylglucosaminyl deacetylase